MKQLFFLLCLLCISFNGNAKSFIKIGKDSTVVCEYSNGNLWQFKALKDKIIGATVYEHADEGGKHYQLIVFIQNISQKSFTIFPNESISAKIVDPYKGIFVDMRIFTSTEYLNKISRRANWGIIPYQISSDVNSILLNQPERDMANNRATINIGYLKAETLHPNESIFGYMNIKREKGNIMKISINIENEPYDFFWGIVD